MSIDVAVRSFHRNSGWAMKQCQTASVTGWFLDDRLVFEYAAGIRTVMASGHAIFGCKQSLAGAAGKESLKKAARQTKEEADMAVPHCAKRTDLHRAC